MGVDIQKSIIYNIFGILCIAIKVVHKVHFVHQGYCKNKSYRI